MNAKMSVTLTLAIGAVLGLHGMTVSLSDVKAAEAPSDDRLHIAWVGMIDNSEGSAGGDCGNFHYQVFPEGSNKPTIHGILYGPSKKSAGYDADYEWGDGHEQSYDAFMIHKWQPGEKSISIKIWESDHGELIKIGPIGTGNRDDVVLDRVIYRDDTLGQGTILDGPKTTMTERPQWLTKLPKDVPRDRKCYFRFVTRLIERSTTYKWVHVGYGDIPHHDAPPPANGALPQAERARPNTVGLGAVTPWNDRSKCHYKTVSALEVIGGRGKNPGEVYECIGPAGGCTFKWILIGRGDIRKNDRGNGPAINGVPNPSLCNAATEGKGAVIPDNNPTMVFYKEVPAEQVRDGGGRAPGSVYKCVCEQN